LNSCEKLICNTHSNPEKDAYILTTDGAYEIPLKLIIHVCDENNWSADVDKHFTHAIKYALLNSRPDALNFVVSCNSYYFASYPDSYKIECVAEPHTHDEICYINQTLKIFRYLEMAENCPFKDELNFSLSHDTNRLFAHLWNTCKHENNAIP
jgi:hypothetical protein